MLSLNKKWKILNFDAKFEIEDVGGSCQIEYFEFWRQIKKFIIIWN